MPDITSIDQFVLQWMNSYAHQNLILDGLIYRVCHSTFLNGSLVFVYLWWLWFRKTRKGWENRGEVLRIFLGIVVALTIAGGLQIFLPGRERPIHDSSIGFILPYGSDPNALKHLGSFPSDHAVILFAIGTAIWMHSRLLGAGAYLWALVFGCLPRVYLGYHYPSDVVGGAVVGTALMAVIYSFPPNAGANWAANRIYRWEQLHPAPFYTVGFLATYELVTMFGAVITAGHLVWNGLKIIQEEISTLAGGTPELVLLLSVACSAVISAMVLGVGLHRLRAKMNGTIGAQRRSFD